MTAKTELAPVEARQQLEDAHLHLEELTGRLERGDFSVRQSDLSQAESRVRYFERVAKGAEAAAECRRAEERDEAGRQLHGEFLADVSETITEADKALYDLGRAAAVAIDRLDAISDLRHGYYAKWNDLFRGHTADEAALLFKMNGNPSGTFGSIAEGRGLPQVNPIETIEAIIAEAVRGREKHRMSGRDADWWARLKQPQIAHGLRDLRNLLQTFKEGEKDV